MSRNCARCADVGVTAERREGTTYYYACAACDDGELSVSDTHRIGREAKRDGQLVVTAVC